MSANPRWSAVAALGALSIGVASATPGGPVRTWTFEQDEVGAAPRGFTFATTRAAPAGRWVVQQDEGGKVLAQLDADRTDGRFAMAIVDEGAFGDLRLSVRGKPVSGEVDQAIGLVWRWQGPDDYYVARANALERNVRLYRVVAGVRRQLAGAEDVDVRAGAWHTLGIEQVGPRVRVSFDGRELFRAEDPTFAAPGKVGVWVKSDSISRFDDLTLEPPGPP